MRELGPNCWSVAGSRFPVGRVLDTAVNGLVFMVVPDPCGGAPNGVAPTRGADGLVQIMKNDKAWRCWIKRLSCYGGPKGRNWGAAQLGSCQLPIEENVRRLICDWWGSGRETENLDQS